MKYEGKTVKRSERDGVNRLRALPSSRNFSGWAGAFVILVSPIAAKLFTSCSHPLCSLPASGLRLETGETSDKKI